MGVDTLLQYDLILINYMCKLRSQSEVLGVRA